MLLSALLACLFSGTLFFVLRVSSAGSFPRPLSSAEEQACLEKMQKGDEEAKRKLVAHNLRLVAHIVKKYYAASSDPEDLISIGTIGLIKAANTFNTEKGIRFSSYAARCIENEILMFFRSSKKSAQDLSINEPIDTDKDGNVLTLMDVMSTEDSICDDLDQRMKTEQLRKYIQECLTPREIRILAMRYGLDGQAPQTQREVASKMQISRSYVSRIEKKALQQLRKRFESRP